MLTFSGIYEFDADRQSVWQALNDPEILKATIPGCDGLSQTGPGTYSADLRLKFGLFTFRTRGELRVEVLSLAESYRLQGCSDKTVFGSGAGVAQVSLRDRYDGGTHLDYEVSARLEGRLANLGASLVSGKLQMLGQRFFSRFEVAMMAQRDKFPQAKAVK